MRGNWFISGAAITAALLWGNGAVGAESVETDIEAAAPEIQSPSDAPSGPEAQRDQIIVYGDKRGRGLQNTEASVLVHTGEEIEKASLRDLYDVIERTPNVDSAYNQKGFSIRGINQDGFASSGGGTGLLLTVVVDNVALPTGQSAFFGPYSAWDLGQVEVFRGGIGTKQGRNALAGAILIRSADPSDEWEAKARASYGMLDTAQLAGAVNIPLVENKLALRVSADYTRTDGWVENPTRGEDDYDGHSMLTFRAKLRYDAGPDTRAIASVSYTDNKGGEDVVTEDEWPEHRRNYSDLEAEEIGEHKIASLELTHSFNDALTLTSITSGSLHAYTRIEDVDMTAAPDNEFYLYRDDWTVAQEVRLNFEVGRFAGIVGLYGTLIHSDSTDDISAPVTAVLDGFLPALPGVGVLDPILEALLADVAVVRASETIDDTRNMAIFGEIDYAITDRLTVTAGARYDYETIEGTYNDDAGLRLFGLPFYLPAGVEIPGVPIGTNSYDSETSFSAFLPKAALSYDWSDAVTTIASVQRGYRAGGRSRAYIQGQIADYDPEYTWMYELAVRTRFGANHFNTNLFYVDWTDQQVPEALSGNSFDTITVNAGHSRMWGIEADAQILLAEGLTAHAAFGYVNTEFLDFNPSGTDLSGNEFPLASRLSASWGLAYEAPFGLVARTDMRFRTATWSGTDNDPELRTDAIFLIDAKLGYVAEHWSIMGYVRNLLDREYRNNRYSFLGKFARTGEPRVAGVEANVRW